MWSTILNIISFLGAVFSIVAALVAIAGAVGATRAKNAAHTARQKLLDHQSLLELGSLRDEIGRVFQVLSKYGPSASESQLEGVNHGSDAHNVQCLCERNHEQLYLFQDERGRVERILRIIQPQIEALANAPDTQAAKMAGRSLYDQITELRQIVRSELDSRQ